jgi:hypothetical protein
VRRLVVVAPPDGVRWRQVREAADRLGVAADVVPWDAVARVDGDLGALALDRPAALKIESPGGCAATLQALLDAGGRTLGGDAEPGSAERGWIAHPRRFALGMVRVLGGVARALRRMPHLEPVSAPWAVAAMLDKPTTARRLAAAGVPCPAGFVAQRADGLAAEIRARGWRRAYVKLRAGACGAGIVRLDVVDGVGLSTVVPGVGGAISGVQPMASLSGAALEAVLAWLVAEGAWVEQALPHLRLGFDRVDLRVVVIDGAARFTVARRSRWPVTNLTLGGRRADLAEVRRALGERAWVEAHAVAEAAAGAFAARVAGVDVVVSPDGRAHVLELNPFGDLFPGLRDAAGRTIPEVALGLWLGHPNGP